MDIDLFLASREEVDAKGFREQASNTSALASPPSTLKSSSECHEDGLIHCVVSNHQDQAQIGDTHIHPSGYE